MVKCKKNENRRVQEVIGRIYEHRKYTACYGSLNIIGEGTGTDE